jgi:release factor glutamine methyltransferase
MSAERAARLQRWHLDASTELHALGAHDVEYLGLHLHVPEGVFPPQAMSQLLGRAVDQEVRQGERVLDMGTGCGVNALLAARQGAQVLAVDVNPASVAAAERNARAAGVADWIECRVGDVFEGIEERFDLIVFDPPFRWFAPGDMLDRAFSDDGYATLRTFFEQVADHLGPDGRVLMFFGTTGDIEYFYELASCANLTVEALSSAKLEKDGGVESYWAFRLIQSPTGRLA